ncbi:MAG TPA: DUF5808 domain-containing protein [Candidatus Limnocylindria bacterium]
MNTLRREIGALGWILRTAVVGLTAAAIYKELQQPAEKRTWHGRLFDFVPYDFRLPTPQKFFHAWWNPDSGAIFSEQPFGIGWTVNLGTVVPMLRGLLSREPEPASKPRRRRASKPKAA